MTELQIIQIQSEIKDENFSSALTLILNGIIQNEVNPPQLTALIQPLHEILSQQCSANYTPRRLEECLTTEHYQTLLLQNRETLSSSALIYSAKVLGLLDPKNTIFLKVMNEFYKIGLYSELVSILEFFAKLNDPGSQRLVMLAEVYIKISLKQKAKVVLRHLIDSSKLEAAIIKYCQILIDEEQFEEAKDLLDAQENHSTNFENNFLYLRSLIHRAYFEYDLAAEKLKFLTQADPNNFEIMNAYGATLFDLGEAEEASKIYQKYIAENDDNNVVRAANHLGVILQSIGAQDESIAAYSRAIQLDPTYSDAIRNLSFVSAKHVDEQKALGLLNNGSSTTLKVSINLNIALYRTNDYKNNFEVAYKHLSQANHLSKKTERYDFNQDKMIFNKVDQSRNYLEALTPVQDKHQSETLIPIFIVGMPRSGTSLLAQILSTHTDISNLGELPYLNYLLFDYAGDASIKEDDLLKIRNAYFSLVKKHRRPKNKIFIDKMPLNFFWVDWIKAIFPEAIIINLNRDRRDLFWSNYSNFFIGKRNMFSCDFNDIEMFYGKYFKFMAEFSSHMFSMQLSKLKHDIKGTVFPILDHLKINWDENMYNFYQNPSIVKTTSALQVKKRLFSPQKPAWDDYLPYLPASFRHGT
jgi:tetratricopeptide (TPR) repeat protein